MPFYLHICFIFWQYKVKLDLNKIAFGHRNMIYVCVNIISACVKMIFACGNVIFVCGNIILTCGNIISACGNIISVCVKMIFACGNIISVSRNIFFPGRLDALSRIIIQRSRRFSIYHSYAWILRYALLIKGGALAPPRFYLLII